MRKGDVMSREQPGFAPEEATGPTLSRRAALLAAAAVTSGIARAQQPETDVRVEERGGDAASPSPPAPGGPSRRRASRFDVDAFVDECRRANEESDPQAAVREVLARAIAEPTAVLRGLGEPEKGGIRTLYRSPTLTVLDIVWAPLMQLMPHEHNMWSLIGIYTGREDNIFWRRAPGTVEAVAAEAIAPGRAVPLPRDVIHSVANPIAKPTGAIHIYGGDFFAVQRSEWDPETLRERAWDIDKAVRLFEQSNARFFAWNASRTCG
ncbi:MAG TPA: hypothetical protein VF329_15415 [Gammaproteobacteria bacterium]